jgi:aminoglycoside 3-N-acetyltransferase
MRVPAPLNGLKQRLRRLQHSARIAYINRFHSFTPAEFSQLLHGLGVRKDDVICVHSSYDKFAGFQGNVGDALKCLQDAVGQGGGIVMPTQPFRSTAIAYARAHAVTDIARAPSLMGLMTEILRRTRGAERSINPTHPVAVWGERGVALLGRDWEARTPCGQGTAYHRLLDVDAKILMLGTGLQPMTFYHCVEELIEPTMPFSPFTAEEYTLQTKDAKGNLYTSKMRLFESNLSARRSMSLLIPELKERGFWTEAAIGRLDVIAVRAIDVLEACRSMARKGRFCYVAPN